VALDPDLITDEEMVVALLHDVVEDTEVTEEKIREVFGDPIADAVALLTHKGNEPYKKYLERIKTCPLATKVKIADIRHNLTTLDRIEDDGRRFRMVKKYIDALVFLTDYKPSEEKGE